MNYYFFPTINGFDSSVTLVNFPSLDRLPSRKGRQNIYATWTDGKLWRYRKIGTMNDQEAKEIKHSTLPSDIPPSPFLFFHYDELPDSSNILFTSNHMHVMPTWRGNIKIFSESAATSYAGDYQYEMVVHIKKGSLVSLSPMLQSEPTVKNVLVFVNLTLTPEISKHRLQFIDPKREEVIFSTEIQSNCCNIIDLSGILIPSDTPILVISHTIAGIPIYLSYTTDRKCLSFEHTHPPASLVVFGEPLYFQRKFKEYWLTKFSHNEEVLC